MMRVTFQGKKYEFELKDVLEGMDGDETMMCEDFLGGWDNFRSPANVTRSTIVILWLAKRSAGETSTFAEIAKIPGLVFGDVWQIEDDEADLDGQSPPAVTPLTTTAPKLNGQDASPSLPLQNVSERAS